MYAKLGIRNKNKKRPMLRSYSHLAGLIELKVQLEK